MNTLDKMFVSAKVRAGKMKDAVKDFMTSEKGVSNVVATVILILIVVLLISFFWGQLQEMVKGWLKEITDVKFEKVE